MKYFIHISILLVLIAVSSCSTMYKTLLTNDFRQIALQRYGNDTAFILNPAQTYVVCRKTTDVGKPVYNPFVEFFIYDINANKEIYSDKINGGTFQWKSNNELLITEQKGIIESDLSNGKLHYLYNVKTSEKRELSKSELNSIK